MSTSKTYSGETVAAYAVRRITELGLAVSPVPTKEFHWHGCPGDYSFSICDAIEDLKSAVWVGEGNELEARAHAARQSTYTFPNSRDLQAGYAADGYARINGMVRQCGLISRFSLMRRHPTGRAASNVRRGRAVRHQRSGGRLRRVYPRCCTELRGFIDCRHRWFVHIVDSKPCI